MTLQEMGAALRAERERRGLGLDDVANQLKISPRLLTALENGDLEALPHKAYAKGFIRSYASWLGLREEDLRATLQKTALPDAGIAQRPEEPASINPSGKKRSGKPFFLVFTLCVLAGAAYYLWNNGFLDSVQKKITQSGSMEEKLQTADDFLASRQAASERKSDEARKDAGDEEEDRSSGRRLPIQNGANSPLLAPIPSPDVNITDRKIPGARPEPVETAGGSAGGEAVPGPEPEVDHHKLVITATEECWVHSNADKTDTRQFSLRKGDTFALTFGKSLELKLGNAGGVRLRYDGRDLPPAGTSGQVRTLVFPPKNDS